MHGESQDLVDRASRGDGVAVERLLELHLPGLEAYARAQVGRLVGERESASDLVQSACREVLEHIDRYRYDGEDGFKRWLYATVLRKIQDRHRYYKAEKRDAGREVRIDGGSASAPIEQLFAGATSATPSRAASLRDEYARVERVLGGLPERHREAIRLAYLEELPHREIAARMGISEANARMLLSRALARLARLLES